MEKPVSSRAGMTMKSLTELIITAKAAVNRSERKTTMVIRFSVLGVSIAQRRRPSRIIIQRRDCMVFEREADITPDS